MSEAPATPPIEPVDLPAAVETPVDAAPAAAPDASEASFDHTQTPTLLQEFDKGAEPAPVETVPAPDAPKEAADAAKEAVAEPAASPAPEPITYPEWKLPEGFNADKDTLGKYSAALGEHRVAPEVGQKLLDLHASVMQQAMTEYAQHLAQEQHRAFGEVRKEWAKQVMADPVLGGAGYQTAMGTVARMRDLLVSDHSRGTPEYKADMEAFNQMSLMTGVADNPIFLRMLHRVGRYLDEPVLPPAQVGPSPHNGRPARGLRDNYTSMNK